MLRIGLRNHLKNGLYVSRSPVINGSRWMSSIEVEEPKKLSVAIVGRPNTGKSTLFNRLTHTKMAIVSNVPGTTRDRREGEGHLVGLPLTLIDTGGLDDRGAVSLSIQSQVAKAFEHSDVVLFMLDGRAGVTALDLHFAQWIRKTLNPSKKLNADGKPMKNIILVANKTEGAHMSTRVMDTVADALSLGFGDPILISASHGDGLADLATELIQAAKDRGRIDEVASKSEKRKHFRNIAMNNTTVEGMKEENNLEGTSSTDSVPKNRAELSNKIPVEDRTIQLAIMGRPNVGKSTLLNAFVRDERSITGPMAGLTRDAVTAEWSHRERQFKLVDTAGLTRIRTNKELLEAIQEKKHTSEIEKTGLMHINRTGNCNAGPSVKLPGRDLANPELDPSQFSYQISEYALISALNALRFAQVVLLVVEGHQGKFSKLDLQLARKCLEEGRGLVIAANKVDELDDQGISGKKYEEGVKEHIAEFMREFGEVPVVVSSGLANRGVDRVLNTVINVHDAWSKRIETGSLNAWLRDLLVTQQPPRVDGKALNIKYMTQVKSRPPTFALFTNMEELPIFFERFLKSNIQEAFQLQGVPIRFVIRKTKGVDIHRDRKLGKKSTSSSKEMGRKDNTVSARSSRSPTGLGSWRAVARGASTKKGLVGPNRDKKYMQRRIAGVVRHKRKSAAGTGTVNFTNMTTKASAEAKSNARKRSKNIQKSCATDSNNSSSGSSKDASCNTTGTSTTKQTSQPRKGGRMKKTAGGLKKVKVRQTLKDAKKAAASKRHTKSGRVQNKQAGRHSRGSGRR